MQICLGIYTEAKPGLQALQLLNHIGLEAIPLLGYRMFGPRNTRSGSELIAGILNISMAIIDSKGSRSRCS